MSWNDLTLNPRVILGYFNQAPSLERIEIYRLILSRDASSLELVFEPFAFPEHPSPKWPPGSNTAQVTLRAIEVSAIELSGWGSNIFGSLSITKSGSHISIAFEGGVKFEVLCSHLEVAHVSGYIKGRA